MALAERALGSLERFQSRLGELESAPAPPPRRLPSLTCRRRSPPSSAISTGSATPHPHTVRAYGEDLEQFARHVRSELGREGRPKDVDHLLIRAFLARLHRQGLKSVSAGPQARLAPDVFSVSLPRRRAGSKPARSLLSPRLGKTRAHLPRREGRSRLVEMPGEGLAGARGRAILELLYATGNPVRGAGGP
jgi:integrase/recombinase XerC